MVSLRRATADDSWLYLIALDAGGTRQGFAVLQNPHDGDGSEFLRRFAVANAGGVGKLFLAALIDWIFTHSDKRALSSACARRQRARAACLQRAWLR